MATDPRLRIDPFFEGESPAAAPAAGTGLIQSNTGPAPAPTLQAPPPVQMPAGYTDAGQQQLADGRTVAQVMRTGPEGLQGTVIPHAMPDGGIPLGTRPHEMQDVVVNIDPHLEGQGSRVRLGDVTPESIAVAEEMARAVTPDPYDTPTTRLRAAAVMQGIATQGGQAVGDVSQHQPPPVTPVTAPGNIPGPHQAQVATPVAAAPRSRPLEHFVEPPPGPQPRSVNTGAVTRPVEYGAAPPQTVVTFEIQGFGLHHANYHDVIVEDGFLVLVYNESYLGGMMYEPPAGPDTPAMALEIATDDRVHLVHTTGFSYSYQGYRFCILMIERSATNVGGA